MSVPGNHDEEDTFDRLQSWHHQAPWWEALDDLIFIGLNSFRPLYVEKFLSGLHAHIRDRAKGVILLTHERPMLETSDLGEVIAAFVGTKELLVLHGHEHPTGFSGAEWHEDDILPNGKRYFRSQVCSSMDRSACGHLIRWENSSFRRWRVEGPWEVVVGEPL